jgi:predicted DNA-binding transcriptional regulator YafY
MDSNIEVIKSHNQLRVDNKDHIQTILTSIGQKAVLRLEYFALHSLQETKRLVEPVGIFYRDNYWHLIAFCRMRDDYRDFRLDRIRTAKVTDELFADQHPTLKDYIAKMAHEQKLETVVMNVDRHTHMYLNQQKYYNGFVSEKIGEEMVEMTFLTMSLEGFARWYLMFGDTAEIVSPVSLIDRVKELIVVMGKKLGV